MEEQRMKPCPYCHKVPVTMLVTTGVMDLGESTLLADVLLCPNCQKVVGLAQANGRVNVWWLWNQLVLVAPEDPTHTQPVPKFAARKEQS